MTTDQQRAVLTVCLMAAYADGVSDAERDALGRLAGQLGAGAPVDVGAINTDVLGRRPSLAELAAALPERAARQLAYEMAVGVCNADGATSAAERDFLAQIAQAFGLDAGTAQSFAQQAAAVSATPLSGSALDGAIVATVPASGVEIDKMIVNYAILNGALELLPQSLASMAIIPLQMKMVYRIGKAHGYELDRGHVTDLLATLGVGLTSQYVEQFGRKLLGGLLGKIGGGLLGGLGSVATGAGFSFATTYALGQVAKRYYAGGRTIDAAGLQQAFASMLADAKTLQGNYAGQIAEQARSLDLGKLLAVVKS